jgi:hypothetical protein
MHQQKGLTAMLIGLVSLRASGANADAPTGEVRITLSF